jgi:two-component system, OmpR family, KDP operon response regulator KdpE
MTSPLILVVEDEAPMRSVLQLALRGQGYDVREAATGAQALMAIDHRVPDVIILDLGLPDMDGVDVARQIRENHRVPIIVLSARSEEQQQIRALDAGANDYITKPFREGELMARIRAALRNATNGVNPNELVAGDLRLDLLRHRVFVDGKEVALTPTEFKLLHLLAGESGRVLSHSQLLRAVWGPSQVDDVQYVRVYMKQLRQKIEDDPAQPTRLLTTPGVGYRLVRRVQ